jgi:hypothetical protein
VRFLDSIKNFGAKIIYRSNKANVLADYLFRSPKIAHAVVASEKGGITRPEEFNRMNLQVIYEHLAYSEEFPSAFNSKWVKSHFVVYNGQLHRVSRHSRNSGNPSHPGGLTTEATILLKIPEVGELHQEARNAHYALSHGSAEAMQQKLGTAF